MTVRILQLAPRIPFPLTEGGSIGIFNITRQLSRRGAEIFFVASSENQETYFREPLLGLCREVMIVRRTKEYGPALALKNLLSPVPVNIEKYHSTKHLEGMFRFAHGKHIDLIHVDHLHMAYYGVALGRAMNIPVVLREHNLELKIMERFADTTSNPVLKLYAKHQFSKFKRYEPTICARVDKCVMITEEDRRRLLSFRDDIETTVIPAGVDTDFFKPVEESGEDNTLAYVGSLDWPPNADGLRWFTEQVLPIILKSNPMVKFYIFGKNPSRDVLKLHDAKNVIVMGFVDDVRDVFRKAPVMVVPLLAGSGMRIKILEAMAAGKAIVTTTIGVEGINCEAGKHIMVADGPERFAEKTMQLLDEKRLRGSIGREASGLAVREYSWDKIGDRFWDTYSEIIKRHRGQRRSN